MQERRHEVRTRRPSMHLAVGARPKLTGDPSPHLGRGADRLPPSGVPVGEWPFLAHLSL